VLIEAGLPLDRALLLPPVHMRRMRVDSLHSGKGGEGTNEVLEDGDQHGGLHPACQRLSRRPPAVGATYDNVGKLEGGGALLQSRMLR